MREAMTESLLLQKTENSHTNAKMEPPVIPMASPPSSEQQYSLRWNDYSSAIISSFRHLREAQDFVDVTLACDKRSYNAHKVVLSACSPYFRKLLKANPCEHPIIILRDIREEDIENLLVFMYNGEVHIGHDHLSDFLKTAQLLQIRGLADNNNGGTQSSNRTSNSSNSSSGSTQSMVGHSNPLQLMTQVQAVAAAAAAAASVQEHKPSPTTSLHWDLTDDRHNRLTPPPQKRIKSVDLYRAQHGLSADEDSNSKERERDRDTSSLSGYHHRSNSSGGDHHRDNNNDRSRERTRRFSQDRDRSRDSTNERDQSLEIRDSLLAEALEGGPTLIVPSKSHPDLRSLHAQSTGEDSNSSGSDASDHGNDIAMEGPLDGLNGSLDQRYAGFMGLQSIMGGPSGMQNADYDDPPSLRRRRRRHQRLDSSSSITAATIPTTPYIKEEIEDEDENDNNDNNNNNNTDNTDNGGGSSSIIGDDDNQNTTTSHSSSNGGSSNDKQYNGKIDVTNRKTKQMNINIDNSSKRKRTNSDLVDNNSDNDAAANDGGNEYVKKNLNVKRRNDNDDDDDIDDIDDIDDDDDDDDVAEDADDDIDTEESEKDLMMMSTKGSNKPLYVVARKSTSGKPFIQQQQRQQQQQQLHYNRQHLHEQRNLQHQRQQQYQHQQRHQQILKRQSLYSSSHLSQQHHQHHHQQQQQQQRLPASMFLPRPIIRNIATSANLKSSSSAAGAATTTTTTTSSVTTPHSATIPLTTISGTIITPKELNEILQQSSTQSNDGSGDGSYLLPCPLCDAPLPPRAFRQHLDRHYPRDSPVCPVIQCGRRFAHPNSVRNHMRIKHNIQWAKMKAMRSSGGPFTSITDFK